jgi:hypothetical protein
VKLVSVQAQASVLKCIRRTDAAAIAGNQEAADSILGQVEATEVESFTLIRSDRAPPGVPEPDSLFVRCNAFFFNDSVIINTCEPRAMQLWVPLDRAWALDSEPTEDSLSAQMAHDQQRVVLPLVGPNGVRERTLQLWVELGDGGGVGAVVDNGSSVVPSFTLMRHRKRDSAPVERSGSRPALLVTIVFEDDELADEITRFLRSAAPHIRKLRREQIRQARQRNQHVEYQWRPSID